MASKYIHSFLKTKSLCSATRHVNAACASVASVFSTPDLVAEICAFLLSDVTMHCTDALVHLLSLSHICVTMHAFFKRRDGLLSALMLEAISIRCVAHTTLCQSKLEAGRYSHQAFAEVHTKHQLRSLVESASHEVLHCATRHSDAERREYNRAQRQRWETKPRQPTCVAPTEMLVVASSVLLMAHSQKLLVILRHTPTSRREARLYELAIFSGDVLAYSETGQHSCTLLSSVDVSIGKTKHSNSIRARKPHALAFSPDSSAIAVACTTSSIEMLSAVWVSQYLAATGLSATQLLTPPSLTHCHAQTMWFYTDSEVVARLFVVYSTHFKPPGVTTYNSTAEDNCSFVIAEYSHEHASNQWLLVHLTCPHAGSVATVSASATGLSVAILVHNELHAVYVCDKTPSVECEDLLVKVTSTQHTRLNMIMSATLSKSAELVAVISAYETTRRLQLFHKQSDARSYNIAATVVDFNGCFFYNREITNGERATYDVAFSTCGRYLFIHTGRHRFGSTKTIALSLDIAPLYRGLALGDGSLRVLYNGVQHNVTSNVHSPCIRQIFWTDDGIWLGLGRGAVLLRQPSRSDEFTTAMLLRGAFATIHNRAQASTRC